MRGTAVLPLDRAVALGTLGYVAQAAVPDDAIDDETGAASGAGLDFPLANKSFNQSYAGNDL